MEKTTIGKTADGLNVDEYTLRSPSGASVKIMTLGAIVTQWNVPDAAGRAGNVVLGFSHLDEYEKPGPYFGAICGRVANRIGAGSFTLDGKTYHLSINHHGNHLHGGIKAYDKRLWTAHPGGTPDAPSLTLSLLDPDGSEGYPGTLRATVTYTLAAATLRIEYAAATDHPTPINLTSHTYFNLKDAGRTDVLGHILQINANAYTPADQNLIPTGEIKLVKGTPLDFTAPKAIGRDIDAIQTTPPGYDHNFVLQNHAASLAQAAVVEEPSTGRRMEVWTTAPGLQLYTANNLDGTITGRDGIVYRRHSALCLETQHFPDSVHHPAFPNTILRPGQTYRHVTEFRFSTTTPAK